MYCESSRPGGRQRRASDREGGGAGEEGRGGSGERGVKPHRQTRKHANIQW